jgi:cupin fold WbuC family metalloprotein
VSRPLVFGRADLERLSQTARDTARRRNNLNFHRDPGEPCQRMLNAIEPGSYVQPHRHLDPAKDETLIVVWGRLGALLFDEAGEVTGSAVLAPGTDAIGIDIPHGVYHCVIALEKGSVFFEAKAGPYLPVAVQERAPWAPDEGDAAVPAYLARLEAMFKR